jgi:hypothetical protein
VYLVAKSDSVKPGECSTEGKPSAHDLPHRLRAPESEIEATTGLGPSAGDAGRHPVAFSPGGDLVKGNGAG